MAGLFTLSVKNQRFLPAPPEGEPRRGFCVFYSNAVLWEKYTLHFDEFRGFPEFIKMQVKKKGCCIYLQQPLKSNT